MKSNPKVESDGRMSHSGPIWGDATAAQHIGDDDDENEDAMGEADEEPAAEGSNPNSQARQDDITNGTQPKRKRPLKLTASQRERKRAIDREAQRSIRIKTKNYIAHLESLVKAMEQSDTNGPDGENQRSRELMNQLRQSQEEVRRLREAMLGVQRVLGGALGDASKALPLENIDQRQPSSSSSPPSGNEVTGHARESFNTGTRPSVEAVAPFWVPPPDPAHAHSSIAMHSDHASPLGIHPARPDKDPKMRQYEGEMFYYAEYHLARVYSAPGPGAFSNRPFDEDIIVRAVIEGWPAVEERYPLDLGWQVLQEIDQVVFPDVGVVERMAALRLLRMKLLHVANSTPAPHNIPGYMTTEVIQQDNRSKVVDSFVWPGFRKLLIETPQRYITNEFNESFRHNLKFLWPFEISDSYIKDPITSLYCSAPEFMRRQSDIRCWTMKRVFFDGYEELYPSVPAFEAEIQKSLPAPGMGPVPHSAPQSATSARPHGSFGMQGGGPMGMVEEHEVEDELSEGSGPGPSVVLPSNDHTAWGMAQVPPLSTSMARHSHMASPVTPMSAGGYWSAGGMEQHHGLAGQSFSGQVPPPPQAQHLRHRGSMPQMYPP
jgi:hypothetical protein